MKAIILHQNDYSLLRLLQHAYGNGYAKFGSLPPTKKDAKHARQIALGLGILAKDIHDLENQTLAQINKLWNRIMREFKKLHKEKKKTFLFVYAAGHGVADQQQYFLLNETSGNIFPIEQRCKDVCLLTKNDCTVFAVFDMCKDVKGNYEQLTARAIKLHKVKEGTGENETRGLDYGAEAKAVFWYIEGAESLGVVAADSILAREILVRMQYAGLDRIIKVPDEFKDFHAGKL